MKKIMVVMGLLASLVVGMLTGCGQAASPHGTGTAQVAPSEAVKQAKTYSDQDIQNAMMSVGYSSESYETETKGQIRTDVKGDFSGLEEGLKAAVIKAITTSEVASVKENYSTAKEYQIVVYQGADKVLSTQTIKNN